MLLSRRATGLPSRAALTTGRVKTESVLTCQSFARDRRGVKQKVRGDSVWWAFPPGSNVTLMAAELATRPAGRYVSLRVMPLSFRELGERHAKTHDGVSTPSALFRRYRRTGGLPDAAGCLQHNRPPGYRESTRHPGHRGVRGDDPAYTASTKSEYRGSTLSRVRRRQPSSIACATRSRSNGS